MTDKAQPKSVSPGTHSSPIAVAQAQLNCLYITDVHAKNHGNPSWEQNLDLPCTQSDQP